MVYHPSVKAAMRRVRQAAAGCRKGGVAMQDQSHLAGVYPASAEFVARAHVDGAKYEAMYAASVADPDGFWAREADRIDWINSPSRIKNCDFTYGRVSIKWFEDGTLNVAANCVDRHVALRGNQTAIIWEPDDPRTAARHIAIQNCWKTSAGWRMC